MLRVLLGIGVACAALACGCSQRNETAQTPPPHLEELPTFPELDPGVPARIGVEGAQYTPRKALVREYKEVEPTPEEREILGEEREPGADLLGFYRKQPNVEQGVSPAAVRPWVGHSASTGGVASGLTVTRSAASVLLFDVSGATVGFGPNRFAAAALGYRTPSGEKGLISRVQVGENPARKGASTYKYAEY